MENNVSNICNFVKEIKKNDVQVINYVYETDEKVYLAWRYSTYCRLHYVIGGKGIFKSNYNSYNIEKGDVFIEFPAQHYCIENVENLEFAYLSFIGTSAIDVMDNLGITVHNCVYKNVEKIGGIWVDNLRLNEGLISLASEGILFLTLTEIGKINNAHKAKNISEKDIYNKVKKHIDDNFTRVDFSLNKMASELSYNPKYLSRVFVKNGESTISEYLNSLRVKYAYALIKRNISSIKDISYMCGFQDPLYFSKVYKKTIGEPPTQTIKDLKK